MKNYVDMYLLPLPKKNLAKYKNLATRFGKMMREYGALQYREFVCDDLYPKNTTSFASAIPLKRTEVLIGSVVEFKSKTHRNQVLKKMFTDPRMSEMMKEKPLMDMKKMCYGGFSPIVEL